MSGKVSKETWKRITLWFFLVISLSINFMGFKDYLYMDEQHRLMKNVFIEDVVGYNYCDVGFMGDTYEL